MQVCKDEAFSSYDKNIIVELQNDDLDQLEANVERCMAWLEKHNSKQ